jgi:TonB family protein
MLMLDWNESAWFAVLAGAALKSTVVLGAAWLLAWALRRRSAAARHLLWTAAAAALLALPVLTVALPALPVRARALAPLAPTVTFRTDAVAKAGAAAPARPQPAGALQPARSAPWRPDFRFWTMLLWATGSALGLAHMLVACAMMGRTRRTARLFPDSQWSQAMARTLGIRHDVELRELPSGAMPMSFGVLRPAVFLPADASEWNDGRRRIVLLHELAHVKRNDTATRLLARTAVCLNWWNPLAWTAWRELVKESERAADDVVLTAGERATEYAGHLLEIARTLGPAPATAWAAVAMARPSQLEGRLLAILDARTRRQSPGRRSALAAAVFAVALVAPFAALEAQDKADMAAPPSVDAAVRAAAEQKDSGILDSAAPAYAKSEPYDAAQQLPEKALDPRPPDAAGLMKLGNLEVERHQYAEAEVHYGQAVALGDTPETAPALLYLAGLALMKKDTVQAADLIDRALHVAPTGPLAGGALTIKGNIALANELPGLAELDYQQALVQDPPSSPEAALTMETYARLLTDQGRADTAGAMKESALTIRSARVVEMARKWAGDRSLPAAQSVAASHDAGAAGTSPEKTDDFPALVQKINQTRAAEASPSGSGDGAVLRVGNGVSAPVLLSKIEPSYSAEALAAKYQGTAVLRVVIGSNGRANNLTLVRSLGFGLDEQAAEAVMQWKFQPGKRDGMPVAVEAVIEVNFRLQ